jgi:hypothetical protein
MIYYLSQKLHNFNFTEEDVALLDGFFWLLPYSRHVSVEGPAVQCQQAVEIVEGVFLLSIIADLAVFADDHPPPAGFRCLPPPATAATEVVSL